MLAEAEVPAGGSAMGTRLARALLCSSSASYIISHNLRSDSAPFLRQVLDEFQVEPDRADQFPSFQDDGPARAR